MLNFPFIFIFFLLSFLYCCFFLPFRLFPLFISLIHSSFSPFFPFLSFSSFYLLLRSPLIFSPFFLSTFFLSSLFLPLYSLPSPVLPLPFIISLSFSPYLILQILPLFSFSSPFPLLFPLPLLFLLSNPFPSPSNSPYHISPLNITTASLPSLLSQYILCSLTYKLPFFLDLFSGQYFFPSFSISLLFSFLSLSFYFRNVYWCSLWSVALCNDSVLLLCAIVLCNDCSSWSFGLCN